MAGKPGRSGRKPAEPREDDFLGIEDLRPDEKDFLDFLEEIGPSASVVEVYRVPKSGDAEWMDVVSFDIIRDGGQGYIRETYGPGKYRLMFKNSGKKYQGHKTIIIGALPLAPAQLVNTNGAHDTRFDFLTSQMAQQQQLVFKLIEGLSNRGSQAPASDPSAMLTAVVTAFSVLKGAADPAAGGNPTKQLRDTLEMIRDAKDIMGGGGDAKEENMYTVLKELGNKFLGGGAPGRPAGPGGAALPGLQTIHAGGSFRVTPMGGAAAAAEQTPPGGAARAVQDPALNAAQWVAAGLAYLKEKAKKGKAVELYQDLIFEHNDEPQFAALLQGIEQGATFENLLQFDPEIADTPALRTWFQKLYDAVRQEIFESVDTGGTGGDANNAGGDAAAGAGGPSNP